jgi:hypothetical protein
MLGLFVALLLALGIVASAVAAWSSESFAEWNWRNQPAWLPSRGPWRRRTLAEARTGTRAAAALWGLGGVFLIVLMIMSLIWT